MFNIVVGLRSYVVESTDAFNLLKQAAAAERAGNKTEDLRLRNLALAAENKWRRANDLLEE